MTQLDHEDFNNSTKCWICERTYEEVEVKVKDYDHVTGSYLGSKRNLNLNPSKNFLLYFIICKIMIQALYLKNLANITKINFMPKTIQIYQFCYSLI